MQLDYLRQRTDSILRNYKVKKAALFGSYSRGTETEKSDIDLLVELDNEMSLLDFVGLKQDLEDSLNKKVDLVQFKKIKPSLKKFILGLEKVFFTYE